MDEQSVGEGEEGLQRFDRDWIERLLSYTDDFVRGPYNAAKYIGARRDMMQWLKNYYDHLAKR